MRLLLQILAAVFLVGLLGIGPACSTQAPPAASGGEAAASSANPTLQSKTTDVKIGTKVGQRVPEFTMRLTDRSQVTSGDLLENDKPVFLYFFASS